MNHVRCKGITKGKVSTIFQIVQCLPHRVFENRPGAQGMEMRSIRFAKVANPVCILRKTAHIAYYSFQHLHPLLTFRAPA